MKKTLYVLLPVAAMITLAFFFMQPIDERTKYERMLRNHRYAEILEEVGEEEKEGEEENDRPDLAMMQDFLRTMDPSLLRPTPEVLEQENTQMARVRDYGVGKADENSLATSISQTQWTERGPTNIGGRTRAIMFDPSDNKKVWAGGVSGGLWVNSDITSASSQWQKVSDFWDNLAITCIAADPTNNQVFYVGTGEGWFNLDYVYGAGIWKTTDGGTSWTKLSSTTGFVIVNDIAVRSEAGNGVVYAAVQGGYSHKGLSTSNNGLQRSTNGGTNWTQVLPSSIDDQYPTDIEIAADGKLFVGARTDASGQASIYTSTDGTSWTTSNFNFDGRVEIATAPSNGLVAYAIFADNDIIGGIRKTTDGGASWSGNLPLPDDVDNGIPANDFSRNQAWYDLILAVHPTNENMVFAGAINLFRSPDGGTNWTQISKWSNNPGMNALSAPLVHADQHNIIFRPSASNEAIIANDGGVYYSPNLTLTPASLSITSRNTNYNVTQFYAGTIHPTVDDFMLAGAQDNGTLRFNQAGLGTAVEVEGGDGAMCFIDELNPSFQIASYVFNDYKLSTNGGTSFTVQLIDDASTGNFINTADYDSRMKVLYTSKTATSLYRVKNITTTRDVSDLNVSMGTKATAIRVSPHTTNQTNLFVGTGAGKLFRVVNANNSPTVTEITGSSFPTGSISSISFGANENQILVTFSNYGINSVWETRDGGTNWANKEGNLPNMPVRWAEYHHLFFDQVYIATELGVWSTDDISVASPVWNSTNGGLANVRTDMLRIRKGTNNDATMMAITHGRGVFTALIPSELSQVITFGVLAAKTFGNQPFSLSATSTSGLPVAFASSDPSIVSISGSVATIAAAGTVVITASQAGNVQYLAAPPVQQTLVVNKAPHTITFNSLPEKTINDLPFTVSATSSANLSVTFESSNTSVATVSGNTVTITGVGSTNIIAKQPGNNNVHAATDVPQELKVVSRTISLTGDLNFGEVIVGEEKSLQFVIENTGSAPATINGINYPSGYTGTPEAGANSTTVTVTFKPVSASEFNGNITVNSNTTSGTNTIPVSGSGILITSLEDAGDNLMKVYPNPSSDRITIELVSDLDQSHLTFTSVKGGSSRLKVEKLSRNTGSVDVSTLPNGLHIISVPANGTILYKKFIKQ